MTPHRDTQEVRLEHWPKLSSFPTTSGVIVAAIILDFLTMFAWAVGRDIPEGWLFFLAGLHGIGTAHFGIKRKTQGKFADDPAKPPVAS